MEDVRALSDVGLRTALKVDQISYPAVFSWSHGDLAVCLYKNRSEVAAAPCRTEVSHRRLSETFFKIHAEDVPTKYRKLREAGSYGYLIQAILPKASLDAAATGKEIVVRLEVDSALPGGLAIYGERFGRYPLDPTLVFELR